MLKIYTASKLHHAKKWQEYQFHHKAPEKFSFHARWLKHLQIGTPDSAQHAREFWQQDEQDVRQADVLLCFGLETDLLRGALVEVGIALANKVPVVICGTADFGTWRYHPGVTYGGDTLFKGMNFVLRFYKANYSK